MVDGFTIDTSELSQLAADLGQVGDNLGPYLRSAIEHTAVEIRNDWRDNTKGLAHAPAFPYSITYDVSVLLGFGASVLKAEIGPDKHRAQGALGNLLEYGSVNNAPRGDGHGALQRNEDDFERGIAKASADAEAAAGFGAITRSVLSSGGRR